MEEHLAMRTTFDFDASPPESARMIHTAVGRLVNVCRAVMRFWDDDSLDPKETTEGLRRAFAESLAALVRKVLSFRAFRP
jgi:hypothetical protein